MELVTDINARFEPDIDAESEAALRRQKLAVQVAAVRRRSRRIKTLRTLLPGAVIALLVLNFGWIAVNSIINGLNVYGGKTDEIRMTNPRFVGQGGKGGHYTISALEAVRHGKDSQTFTLKAPIMDFRGESESGSHVIATSGVLDQQARTFTMAGDVRLTTGGGGEFTLKTSEAVVDIGNSTIHGDKHIEGLSAVGHIEGEAFVISNSGDDIVFNGRGDTQVNAVFDNGAGSAASQAHP